MITLVTGFGAFGGVDANPSEQLLARLAAQARPDLRTLLLPVSFARAPHALRKAIRTLRPERVLALGVAPSRRVISLEKVALNWCDARIPDNDQAQPLDQPLKRSGPDARFARWPLSASLARIRALGIPCELSLSAGSFVCNAVYYGLLDAVRRRRCAALFVHVPPNAELGEGLPLELQWQALQALLATRDDEHAACSSAEGSIA